MSVLVVCGVIPALEPLDGISSQPQRLDVGRDATRRLGLLQLLPAVDDRGTHGDRVARDEDQALALGEVEAGERAAGGVTVAGPKFGLSDPEPFEHHANVPQDVTVLLPGALRDLQARHGGLLAGLRERDQVPAFGTIAHLNRWSCEARRAASAPDQEPTS